MTFLLDTNACIKLLNEDRTSSIAQRLVSLRPIDIKLRSIVEAELYYGAYRSSRREGNLARLKRFCSQFESLPFDHAAATVFGYIRTQLENQGIPIGPYDLMIAAIALSNDLILVIPILFEATQNKGGQGGVAPLWGRSPHTPQYIQLHIKLV